MSRPPEIIDLHIDAVTADGDGEGMLGPVRVAVPFSIPGELVRVQLLRSRDRHEATGRMLSVLTPSPHRVAPRCRHFGPAAEASCGGCSWQHLAYPAQLELKRALVADAVGRVLREPPPVEPTIPSGSGTPWHYRQKVHFVFGEAGRNGRLTTMGHYARGTRHVVPVVECPVHDDRGNAVAFRLAEALAASGRSEPPLASVVARVSRSAGDVMVTLVTEGPPGRRLRDVSRKVLTTNAGVTSLHASIHSGRGSLIFGDRTRRVSGTDRIADEIDGITYLISPTTFFQTNGQAAAELVRTVIRAVPAHLPVLELYCGSGLFALPLAKRGQTVIGIESNRVAVADAVASRHANRIPPARCRFVATTAESGVTRIHPRDARCVVLDPPRSGASTAVLDEVLQRLRPDLLVYVSCDPQSLAADLGRVEWEGYRITSLQPLDMFPHTADIETVAVARPVEGRT